MSDKSAASKGKIWDGEQNVFFSRILSFKTKAASLRNNHGSSKASTASSPALEKAGEHSKGWAAKRGYLRSA